MPNITIALTEKELATAISGLLFSCSVNVVSDTDLDYQTEMLSLAKKLKDVKPDIKLEHVRFVKEEDYEDVTSPEILNCFETNMEITNFDNV